jgi:hypothetical protein
MAERDTMRDSMTKRLDGRTPQNVLGGFEPSDFSVVVKNRAQYPKPWRWEIHRAGRNGPVDQSAVYFETMALTHRAGKEALKIFLAKQYD